MKKFFAVCAIVVGAFLASCGDNDGDNGVDAISEESSSSVVKESSSSKKVVSSSSVKSSSSTKSSSSAKSSSSKKVESSSSSAKLSSSSVASSSSLSVHERLTEKYGECIDYGIAYAYYEVETIGKDQVFYTCYMGEWSEGYIDVDRYPWEPPTESWLNPNVEYGEMTDSRDGKVYKTVKIGRQVWMAENLRYADSVATPSLKGNNWCYKDREETCEQLGRFYSWMAAIDSVKLANDPENPLECGMEKKCGLDGRVQGICDKGWHLPSSDEIYELQDSAKDYPAYTAAWMNSGFRNLRTSIGWKESCTVGRSDGNADDAGNMENTNGSGFSALPVGYRYTDGRFIRCGLEVGFWSSTEYKENYAVNILIECNFCGVWNYKESSKLFGFNIRCVKDD